MYLTCREHAEQSPALCLAYVEEHAKQGDPQSVVDTIDAFQAQRFMMNVGPTKGAIVDAEIRRIKPTIMAELGSYSGYSAVRFASLQREVAGPNSHYYSFEYSPKFAEVVKETVAFAGLADQITIFVGKFSQNYHELKGKTVDLHFIDHEKSECLMDAKLILKSGTLRKGSVLTADNVIMSGAPDYVEFLLNHPQLKSHLDEVTKGPNGE